MKNKTRVLILAAGKGTRMQSPLPKALAVLNGKHMIKHLLESVNQAEIDEKPIVVVGFEKELVMKELGDKYEYVVQEEQLGTGHAVFCAEKASGDAENIVVISGDQPFIKAESIKNLLAKHLASGATITITTTEIEDFKDWRAVFTKFGRVIRKDGKVIDREYKDASEEEKEIKELNASCYVFNAKWLWENSKKVDRNQNSQKEYYLTDLWQIASLDGSKIETQKIEPMEALSANSKEELEILEKFA